MARRQRGAARGMEPTKRDDLLVTWRTGEFSNPLFSFSHSSWDTAWSRVEASPVSHRLCAIEGESGTSAILIHVEAKRRFKIACEHSLLSASHTILVQHGSSLGAARASLFAQLPRHQLSQESTHISRRSDSHALLFAKSSASLTCPFTFLTNRMLASAIPERWTRIFAHTSDVAPCIGSRRRWYDAHSPCGVCCARELARSTALRRLSLGSRPRRSLSRASTADAGPSARLRPLPAHWPPCVVSRSHPYVRSLALSLAPKHPLTGTTTLTAHRPSPTTQRLSARCCSACASGCDWRCT